MNKLFSIILLCLSSAVAKGMLLSEELKQELYIEQASFAERILTYDEEVELLEEAEELNDERMGPIICRRFTPQEEALMQAKIAQEQISEVKKVIAAVAAEKGVQPFQISNEKALEMYKNALEVEKKAAKKLIEEGGCPIQ